MVASRAATKRERKRARRIKVRCKGDRGGFAGGGGSVFVVSTALVGWFGGGVVVVATAGETAFFESMEDKICSVAILATATETSGRTM